MAKLKNGIWEGDAAELLEQVRKPGEVLVAALLTVGGDPTHLQVVKKDLIGVLEGAIRNEQDGAAKAVYHWQRNAGYLFIN